MSDPTIDELLQEIRSALTSLELEALHRLGARHEAAVHASIDQRLAAIEPGVD